MTFKPPGYVSIASTPDEARLDRICECPACKRDGQHEPMCNLHDCDWDQGAEQVCDCPKGDEAKEARS